MRAPSPSLPTALAVLRNRDFRIYWMGQAVSLCGTWMQQMAQSWLVLGLTSSAFALGLVNFAMAIPTLILALLGGAVADQIEKRRILLMSQTAMMILAFILSGLAFIGQVEFWHVLVISALLGIATAYDLPAMQAMVPELVQREEISKAVALQNAIFHGSRFVGPAIAGLVIGAVGVAGAFFANGVSYIAVIASLLVIRSRAVGGQVGSRSQAQVIGEGLAYVRGEPLIVGMLGFTALTAVFVFPSLVVMLPIYARDVLLQGASEMGFLMAVSGAGALVGSIVLLAVPRERQLRYVGMGASLLVVSLSALAWIRSFPAAMGTVAVMSLGISLAMGLAATIIQEHVRPELRGRVMGLYSLTFMGVIPFSALAATALADLFGLPAVMQGSAIAYGLCAIAILSRFRAANATALRVEQPEAVMGGAKLNESSAFAEDKAIATE